MTLRRRKSSCEKLQDWIYSSLIVNSSLLFYSFIKKRSARLHLIKFDNRLLRGYIPFAIRNFQGRVISLFYFLFHTVLWVSIYVFYNFIASVHFFFLWKYSCDHDLQLWPWVQYLNKTSRGKLQYLFVVFTWYASNIFWNFFIHEPFFESMWEQVVMNELLRGIYYILSNHTVKHQICWLEFDTTLQSPREGNVGTGRTQEKQFHLKVWMTN